MTTTVERGSHSSRLRLRLVPAESLELFWPGVQPSIKLAMAKTDEADDTDLIELLLDGSAQLLVEFLDDVPQGCAISMVANYPKFSALEIIAIAGLPGRTTRYPNAESLELLKRWARILGCKRIQGFANEAVARLWRRIGFKEISRKMGIDL